MPSNTWANQAAALCRYALLNRAIVSTWPREWCCSAVGLRPFCNSALPNSTRLVYHDLCKADLKFLTIVSYYSTRKSFSIMLCSICQDMGLHFDDIYPRWDFFWKSRFEPRASEDFHKTGNSDSQLRHGSNSTLSTEAKSRISCSYRHHSSYRDLKASAAYGCEICCLFLSEVTAKRTRSRGHLWPFILNGATELCPQDYGQIRVYATARGIIDLCGKSEFIIWERVLDIGRHLLWSRYDR
jgi:hypothetical protein